MKKLIFFTLAFALLGTAWVSAYDLDVASPTAGVTSGRFSEDKDNYLDLTGWADLTGNVLFLQFGGPGNSDPARFQFGTGYWLSEGTYLGGFLETALPRTDVDNSSDVTASDLTLDGSGNLVSTEETVETSVDERKPHQTKFTLLYGMNMGEMNLGVKNTFERGNSSDVGTLAPTLNWGTDTGLYGTNVLGTNPVTINSTTQTTTRTTVTDADGEITYEDVDAYDEDGAVYNANIDDTLSAGLRMPLGDMTLEAMLFVPFSLRNKENTAGRTQFTRVVGNDLPSYQDLEHVTTHNRTEGTINESDASLSPSLNTLVSMPLSEQTSLEFGLNYNLDWQLFGESTYAMSETDYTATSNGTDVETVTTESVWNKTSDNRSMSHTVGIPLGISVQPAENFRYSVSYTPSYEITTQTETISADWSRTETTENTDDTIDTEVIEETTTLKGAEEGMLSMQLAHNLNLGAQFFLTEKIRVNTGTSVSMNTLNWARTTVNTQGNSEYRETETIGDNDPVVLDVDSPTDLTLGTADGEEVDNSVQNNPNVNYRLGFTYLFSEDMELDFVYQGVTGANADSNIFNAGVWSALMTIRY